MSNFLGEILQAKGTASFEDLYDTLKTLENRINHLKALVVKSLSETFVLFEADLDRVIQWFTQIEEIQKELEDLEYKFSEDKIALQTANQDLDLITSELDDCTQSIRLLRSLVDIVKNFEGADPVDFYHASERIKQADNELASISVSFPAVSDHIWIKQLRARFSDLTVDVYDKCRKEWNNLFKFEKHSLSIYPHSGDTAQLIQSLKNVKSFRRIWDKFADLLWQELFKPACSRDYKIEVHNTHDLVNFIKEEIEERPVRDSDCDVSLLNSSMDGSVRMAVVIKAKKLDRPYNNAAILFDNLTVLIKVLRDVFARSPEEMVELSRSIAPKIDGELQNKYLKSLILERCDGDIDKARADVSSMGRFTENLAEKYNFVFPEGNVFEEIETNFDCLFQKHVRTALIVKLRDLIKEDVQNTLEINHEANRTMSHDEIVLLRKNPALFPKCIISQSIADVVKLLENHMRQYPGDVEMCDSVFSIYLATLKIPKHESDPGAMIPLRAVLIHNNSLFLAHHAGFTFEICDMVPELRVKASQAIAYMMRSIRSSLNELITTAMTSIQERVDRNIDITHDFLVITAEIKRLDGVIGSVLPAISWQDILATLVDHTLNEICLKILAWEDISANSASELARALTQFATATSSIFKGDALTPREIEALTSRAVKKWQRFRLIIFILTASMKDIDSKWVGGCGPLANEFTAEEVRRLIRALFQNTDRRAAFLATIK